MGLLKIIFAVLGVVILAVVGLGAYLYFTDYEAKGTVTQKGSDSNGAFVVIRPDLIPRDIKQSVDANAAQFVCVGYQVSYRIQSGHYQVLDTRGRLVYDSVDGLNDAFAPTRCAVLGS